MIPQMAATRNCFGGRGFSSASAVCGLGGHRSYAAASVHHPLAHGCGVHGFGSQSLSNMGGSRRISYGGFGAGCNAAGYGCGHAGFGGRVGHWGPRMGHGGQLGGYGSFRGDGIQGVRVNEKLLKPLHVGVDPQEHEVRNHEREEMKTLNNQFAGFIDKVRYLEQQNKVLETKWNLLQECAIPARKSLEPYYENFICNMKKQLNCLLSDREQLTRDEATVQNLVEEFKCKYEEEVKRRTTAENDFVLLKKDVDSLFLSKEELDAKLDVLSRELEFRRCIYMEELAQLDGQVCDTNILLQMDNSRDLDIDCIIKNVEAWYLSVAQRSKEEVNALYENRFQELQAQRGKFSNDLKVNQHEIENLARLVHKLQSQHDTVKQQVACLQSSICEVEQRGDGALKDARDKHIDLQTALQKAKDDLAGLLRDYHDLLNTKLALDIEIATYRTLLEGEESRIFTGNHVTIDVVKPPCVNDLAGFTTSHMYGPVGGGYGVGHGRCGAGHGNYSSRSVGHCSRNAVSSRATTGRTFADAEFSATGHSSRSASHSVDKPSSTPVGVDSASRDFGSNGGLSSGSVQGSVSHAGRGCVSGGMAQSCPDGGYLSGGYMPVNVMPLSTGGFGPGIIAGHVVMGCPGVVGGADMGGVGVPVVGMPAVGMGGIAIAEPCVEVGAPIGVCYSGAVAAPVGMCYPGVVGLM